MLRLPKQGVELKREGRAFTQAKLPESEICRRGMGIEDLHRPATAPSIRFERLWLMMVVFESYDMLVVNSQDRAMAVILAHSRYQEQGGRAPENECILRCIRSAAGSLDGLQ